MIYEYFVCAVFWNLILIYFVLSRINVFEIKTRGGRKGKPQFSKQPPKGTIKYRIYSILLIVLFICYLCTSLACAILIPGILLRTGISAEYLIYFVVFNILAAIWGIFVIYFYRLWKFLKETHQATYRSFILDFCRNTALVILLISTSLFVPGLKQIFNLQSWSIRNIPIAESLTPSIMLLVFGFALLFFTGSFLIFIFRRTGYSLRQYWILFIIAYITVFLYGLFIPGQILDWNSSILTRTQLLSVDYGLVGWILILLFVLALFFSIGSIVLLRIKDLFNQNGKPKGLSLVHLELGYISLMLTAFLLVFPQIVNIL